jgi:DNA mismatch repair protein MutS
MPPKRVKSGAKKGDAVEAPAVPPMEALYYSLYDENVKKYGSKVAILLQVGKFFEMYDSVDIATGVPRSNVQVLAELCGAAIEHKPSRDPTKTRLFWGFPEASLRKFERMLVAAGYSTFPYIQTKDTAGVVLERTLDHIGSPGTLWDAEGGLAVRREEQCMVSLYIEPWLDSSSRQSRWHVAASAFDVMTGQAVSTETDVALIDGKPVLDSLQPFLSMYPPAELLLHWCSTGPAPKESECLALFAGTGKRPPVHCIVVDPKVEGTAAQDRIRLAFLAERFRISTALSLQEQLGISMYPMARRSLHALLQFVHDHNPSFLTGLHDHRMWTPDDAVLLGNAALEQLAMLPCHSEKQHESLLYWLQKATTAMGKRTLRERCLTPIADVAELEARQDRIAALRNAEVREPLQATLRGAFDLSRLLRRFQLGHGTTDDLLHLLHTYEKADRLLTQTATTAHGVDDLEGLRSHISSLLRHWNADRIRASKQLVSDSIAVGSAHPWARGIHADLDSLEDQWTALLGSVDLLRKRWEGYLEETDSITWTLREDCPFTLTTTSRRATVLATLVKRHKQGEVQSIKKGASTTVTLDSKELAEANLAALKLRAEWKEIVRQRWAADWITWMEEAMEGGWLEVLVDFMGRLDAECAFASVAEAYGYVRPTYVESTADAEAGVYIEKLRHPIIERVHTDTPYIPHTLSLGFLGSSSGTKLSEEGAAAPCGILLYGVNAAGKSSLGKALGLAVLMAQCGIPVPATAMTLIPYTGLFTRILGNDNLWAGMSSFVVEMTEFRSILRSAGPRTLVIGDELCAGTETASATAIVAAGIQTLIKRNTQFLFATHLHELMELPDLASATAVRPYHLTVRSDPSRQVLLYDRILRPGCGSPMYGLEVCRGLDMDREFLVQAFAIRKQWFTEDGKVRTSRYNASLVVDACQICGSKEALETHHIVPQAAASADGRIAPGVHKNAKFNLAVLCDGCHEKHHRGLLEIQGWKATSEGRILTAS